MNISTNSNHAELCLVHYFIATSFWLTWSEKFNRPILSIQNKRVCTGRSTLGSKLLNFFRSQSSPRTFSVPGDGNKLKDGTLSPTLLCRRGSSSISLRHWPPVSVSEIWSILHPTIVDQTSIFAMVGHFNSSVWGVGEAPTDCICTSPASSMLLSRRGAEKSVMLYVFSWLGY